MATKTDLVIVESPSKAKTIGKYLGPGYEVVASMGHVRDLPKSKLGVDVEHGFQPDYQPIKGKEETITALKKAAKKSGKVYLATDPDREGEAISWHLKELLNIPDEKTYRVTFNEITKRVVNESIAAPRAIDQNLVDAQQARRILDRIVGYELSPLLWKKIRRGLSAGRVQSVATRLVVEREEEIRAFQPQEYWSIQADLSREQLKRIEALAREGKAAPAEVAEAKARVAQDELQVVQTDNDYRLALLDLAQLIELDTPEGFQVEEPADEVTDAPLTPPDEIYQMALAGKPVIQAAKYRLEGSLHSIRIAQSAYYPQLSLNGSLGTSYYSTINRSFSQQMQDNFSKYVGFSLSVPLFNRLATRNRVRTARLQRENYALQLDDAKKTLYKEIQQAWYNAAAAISKYHSSRAATKASDESFLLTKKKYECGQANAVEYNEARQNLVKARSDELQAKYEYLFRVKILDFYQGTPIE